MPPDNTGASANADQNVNAGTTNAAANATTTGQPTGPAWYPDADANTAAFIQAKQWQNPAAAINSYIHLEKLFGADKAGNTVQIPGEAADQTVRDAFYNRLGRPESADKYSTKSKDFTGMPEDVSAAFITLAHKEGLTDKQVQAITKWNNDSGANLTTKIEQDAVFELNTQQAKLKSEWGAAHDQNMQIAKEAATKLGWTKDQIDAMQLGLGFDGVMRLAHQLGVQVGEGKFIQGEGGRENNGGNGKMTPAQASAELNKLQTDQTFMKEWLNKDHPNHAAAVNRKAQLSSWSIGQ